MKNKIKKYVRVGPGGRKCTCCFPAPGKRKEVFRTAKRKEKKDALKIENDELLAIEAE